MQYRPQRLTLPVPPAHRTQTSLALSVSLYTRPHAHHVLTTLKRRSEAVGTSVGRELSCCFGIWAQDVRACDVSAKICKLTSVNSHCNRDSAPRYCAACEVSRTLLLVGVGEHDRAGDALFDGVHEEERRRDETYPKEESLEQALHNAILGRQRTSRGNYA